MAKSKKETKSNKELCTHTPDGILIRGPEGHLTREFRAKYPEEAARLDEQDG